MDLQIVQDLQIVPQISVCMQRGNIMVFIQHKDAFIYFMTLDPEVGNLPSKFRDKTCMTEGWAKGKESDKIGV